MKLRNLCIIALSIILIACNTSKTNFKGFETTTVNGVEIPIIRLDLAPDSAKIINLSALIREIDIIPLETKKECLISYAHTHFSKDNIYVWTQVWPRVYLYKFDNNGKFIQQIGKQGKGPGEHTGNSVNEIHVYDNKKQIEVHFGGTPGEMPKLFDNNGNYIHDIKYPYKLMSNFNRYNDSIWFSLGSIAGNPHYKRDSIMLVFFDKDGKVLKEYPRLKYPPTNTGKFTPSGWINSIYKFNNQWQIYNPGNDTLYKLEMDELFPAAIFHRGKNRSQYNEDIPPTEIIGKYDFTILTEANTYLIINKSFTTNAQIREFRPGQWGGMYDKSDFIIIIDKINGEQHNIRIKDDILGIFPEKLLTSYITNWSASQLSGSKQAIDLKEEITEALKNDELPENARARLTKLNSELLDDDNPVVFRFLLKDRFEL